MRGVYVAMDRQRPLKQVWSRNGETIVTRVEPDKPSVTITLYKTR